MNDARRLEFYREEFNTVFQAPDAFSRLEAALADSDNVESEDENLPLLEAIYTFLNYFAMFKDVPNLFGEIFEAVTSAIELLEAGEPEELAQLLQKSILLRFVDAYVTFAQLDQKEKILDILSTSLESLAPMALFINLVLLVKPVYASEEYLAQKAETEVTEIEYADYQVGGEAEARVKAEIDAWIKTQDLDLDKQAELHEALVDEFTRLCEKHGITDAATRKELGETVEEMLTMQLTLLSLAGFGDDEDLRPVPIS